MPQRARRSIDAEEGREESGDAKKDMNGRRRQDTHGEGERKGRGGGMQTYKRRWGLTSGDPTQAAGLSHASCCLPTSLHPLSGLVALILR